MSKITMKVTGLREIEKALATLPKATAKNVVRRVLKARAQPIAEHARQLVSVDEGHLRESIVVSTKLSRAQRRKARKEGKSSVLVYVGPDSNPTAHWLEFGTGPRYHKSGKFVGSMPPKPFMRPAWDGGKSRLLDGIKEDIWTEIRKASARLAKKAAKANGG